MWIFHFVLTSLATFCLSVELPPLTKTEDLIKSFGYSVEKHEVKTEDGYILEVYRIPGKGSPILVLHGMLASSDVFCLSNNSIVYHLNSAGHDVWMINFRGSYHSRNHATLQVTDPLFWQFSFEEYGLQDIPAVIDYIVEQTKEAKVKLLGHSMGASVVFILASDKPQVMSKVSSFLALSPIYSINRYNFLFNKESPMYPHAVKFINDLRNENKLEGFPRNDTPASNMQFNCSNLDENIRLYCSMIIEVAQGSFGQWVPSGTSLNVFDHFIDITSNGKLVRYNYGATGNLKAYNQETPLDIKFDNITIPIFVVYSDGDEIIDTEDIEVDKKTFPTTTEFYKIDNEDFQHADYVYPSKDELQTDYSKMVNYIKEAFSK